MHGAGPGPVCVGLARVSHAAKCRVEKDGEWKRWAFWSREGCYSTNGSVIDILRHPPERHGSQIL